MIQLIRGQAYGATYRVGLPEELKIPIKRFKGFYVRFLGVDTADDIYRIEISPYNLLRKKAGRISSFELPKDISDKFRQAPDSGSEKVDDMITGLMDVVNYHFTLKATNVSPIALWLQYSPA